MCTFRSCKDVNWILSFVFHFVHVASICFNCINMYSIHIQIDITHRATKIYAFDFQHCAATAGAAAGSTGTGVLRSCLLLLLSLFSLITFNTFVSQQFIFYMKWHQSAIIKCARVCISVPSSWASSLSAILFRYGNKFHRITLSD